MEKKWFPGYGSHQLFFQEYLNRGWSCNWGKLSRFEQLFAFVYFISYFNPRIGLTGNEDFSRPLYEILGQDYNSIAKLSKEEISAISSDSVLAEKLEIKTGEPILKRKRFVFDPGSRPLEWNVGYYKADSFTYTLEFERET